MERIKNFFKDESGASAVEYGLLVALIAVGLIGAMGGLKDSIATAFTSAGDALTAAKHIHGQRRARRRHRRA